MIPAAPDLPACRNCRHWNTAVPESGSGQGACELTRDEETRRVLLPIANYWCDWHKPG